MTFFPSVRQLTYNKAREHIFNHSLQTIALNPKITKSQIKITNCNIHSDSTWKAHTWEAHFAYSLMLHTYPGARDCFFIATQVWGDQDVQETCGLLWLQFSQSSQGRIHCIDPWTNSCRRGPQAIPFKNLLCLYRFTATALGISPSQQVQDTAMPKAKWPPPSCSERTLPKGSMLQPCSYK